eukprot:NODE_5208_length_969_cov_95.495272_g4996_i0.p1 GENE.NODE_5208_length_969_cov_95.495272_g4996_i0~~NODE_5208_length_969_cov_95.495272_g4996_i0.p1  ORF type:complete len:184 (+),score=14.86 NODE_5208_length_969_cov_95.495272_g4996_i0:362-913(+)
MRHVLLGLQYIHSNHIVHRDVKPLNILISESGEAKLGDFGTSRAVSSDVSATSPTGTPVYMSPELLQNQVGLFVDIWAVGITTLEILTNERPWGNLGAEVNMYSLVYHITHSMGPTLPDWLLAESSDFIGACLMRDHLARPTASQLLDHPFLTMQHHSSPGLPPRTGLPESGTSSAWTQSIQL